MLLILAHSADETAREFAKYAAAAGVRNTVVESPGEADLCMTAGRDGRCAVGLKRAGDPFIARAILNRGLVGPEELDAESQFRSAEWHAAWWSGLACFDGPVVNRPTRFGFTPALDPLSLVKDAPVIRPPTAWITVGPCPQDLGPEINVHRARDGGYVVRLQPGHGGSLEPGEVFVFTEFDPSQTTHLLLAGDRLFNLSDERGRLPRGCEEECESLGSVLRARGATFSLAVVERRLGGVTLLHATAFPTARQYRHLATEVHRALLDYLYP